MSFENVDRRVMGAVRFVDAASGWPIGWRLRVTPTRVRTALADGTWADRASAGVRLFFNRRWLCVIAEVPGFGDYSVTFDDAPDAPDTELELTIEDPTGIYLARRVVVALPRAAHNPDRSAGPLFSPVDVPLFPSAVASPEAGWSSLRVSVKRPGSADGVPDAYIVVASAAAAVLARGMADERGEALVPIAGVQIVNLRSDLTGAVSSAEADLTVTAYDSATAGAVPNPDDIAKALGGLRSASAPVTLRSGREKAVKLEVAP